MSHNKSHALNSADDHAAATDDWTLNFPANKTKVLNPVVWDDMRIVPGAFTFPGPSDPLLGSWQPGGAGESLFLYKFNAGNFVDWTCQIPHTYKQGEDIFPHVHWTPHNQGVANNGNTVIWEIAFTWANVNAVFPSTTLYTATDTCDGVDDKHLVVSTSVTPSGSGKLISGILKGKLRRIAAGDTWSGTNESAPGLLELDFHFPIDTEGSRQEFVK